MTAIAVDDRPPADLGLLSAGDLSARLDATGLRGVRLGRHELLRRVFAPIRDARWATVPANTRVVELGADHAILAAEHAGVPVRTRLEVRLTRDSVVVDFTAEADDEVEVNRAGLCLLHPLSQVGASVSTAVGGTAPPTLSRLPALVAPQPLVDGGPAPMLGPFDRLAIEDDAVRIDATFTGDLFEMEDQRNWMDASFKTYCTPLSTPRPRRLHPGSQVHQRVELRVTRAAGDGDGRRRSSEAPAPLPPRTARTRLEALLLDPVPHPRDLETAVDAGVDAFRVEVRVADAADRESARTRAEVARAAGAEVTLVAFLPSAPGAAMSALVALVRDVRPELLLIHDEDARSGAESECTTTTLIDAACKALVDARLTVPTGGGSPFNLCEFQRHDLRHLQLGAFSLTPTVHADDPESVRDTVEALPAMVATADARLRGRPLLVGPLYGRQREHPLERPHLPDADWTRETVRFLRRLGVARLCTVDVAALVRDGGLTPHGLAVLPVGSPDEGPWGDHSGRTRRWQAPHRSHQSRNPRYRR